MVMFTYKLMQVIFFPAVDGYHKNR